MAVNSKETYDRGLEIRRSVLGEEYVARSINNVTDFSRPMQELVTEYCWGAVWGREELPKRIRSMLNIGMLAALNRPHELKLHVQGALRNGVSREEISEILLQVAIYCGVPAAIDSLRLATEAIDSYDKAAPDANK
jgi:4-carboxymuconolactone decarboxylase